ncbi:MAG: HDOD domain-containing protein [Syntrophobacteraceae bacterium]|nr:HDOD domain-containing protein [Desulfobacteraceae bacterium]
MVRELSELEVQGLHYELMLKDIISAAEKLPPFPDIAWKVLALIRKTAPVGEIEAVIRYDQAITARVLALSQSMYYRRRHNITSIQDAIVVLGGQKLVQIVLAACSERYYTRTASSNKEDDRALWHHSVSTAIVGDLLARRLRHRKILTIYTACLLHDIGKTVLNAYARIYLHSSLNQIRGQGMEVIEAERKALGIGHQELGEMIARRWHFPSELVMSIGHHHDPLKALSDQDVASIVYAANQVVTEMDREDGDFEWEILEEDAVFKGLGIRAVDILDFQDELVDAMSEISQSLSL